MSGYLYGHLYKVAGKLRANDPKCTALLFLVAIWNSYAIMLLLWGMSKFSRLHSVVIWVLVLMLSYLVYRVVKKCVYNKNVFKAALKQYNNESRFQQIFGCIISFLLVLLSPFLSLFFVRCLKEVIMLFQVAIS